MSLLCPDCHMLFNSAELLSKHRTRFCLGTRDVTDQSLRPPIQDHNVLRQQPAMNTSPSHSGVMSPLSTMSSMSIRLSSDEEDDAPMPPDHENRQRHLRRQADHHGQNLAKYKNKSRELTLQKNEIDRRLQQLGMDPFTGKPVDTSLSLQQLRAQEARNTRALADLKQQTKELSSARNTIPIVSKKTSHQGENEKGKDQGENKTTSILESPVKRTVHKSLLSKKYLAAQQKELKDFIKKKETSLDLNRLHEKLNQAIHKLESDLIDLNHRTVPDFYSSEHTGFEALCNHIEGHGTSAIYKSADKSREGNTCRVTNETCTCSKKAEPRGAEKCSDENLANLDEEASHNCVDLNISECLKNLQSLIASTSSQGNSAAKHDVPISSNSSLITEIKALRQLYLQQGGNHQQILAQIADLEAEAKLLESNRQPSKGNKAKYDSVNEQLLAFEVENRRLQQELLETQDRNNQLLARRTTETDDDVEADRLRRRQDEYRRRLSEMEAEIELLKRQARLASIQREVVVERERPGPQPVQEPPPQDTYRPPANYERPAEVPALMNPQPHTYVNMDKIPNGPYDKNAGFMVFYDFATGLDLELQACRLVVSLYNNTAQYGQPSVLPTVYCDSGTTGFDSQRGAVYNSALISAKQPVPRCPPAVDLGLVVELQVAGPGGRLATRGWCRLNLFDHADRLISGRWRVPFKILPLRPDASMAEFYSVPQYGAAELYLRVVNHRDADSQSMGLVGIQNASRYQDPPQAHTVRPAQYVPPPPTDTPPDSPTSYALPDTQRYDYDDQDMFTVGFQIGSVKRAEPGEGKVRITAYYKTNGKVVQTAGGPLTANTTSVKSTFRHKCHVFGQQEALFTTVDLRPDVVLIIRFYLRKSLSGEYDGLVVGPTLTSGVRDDEYLVAWTTMPLLAPRGGRGSRSQDLSDYRIRSGTHTLPLYHPPVPDPETVPLGSPKHWQPYNGGATVRFHVFVSRPRPGSLTPSESEENTDDSLPEYAWIPSSSPRQLTEPYNATDGFDVYIDGCRFLPDAVTFTRIAGRILSRSYEKIGKDLNTNVNLDSDIYNPVYDYRVEIREPSLPPTATVLLKVYTIDKFTKDLTIVGYAALNVFVEIGSNKQPSSDTAGIQLSLNEGAHQLRLYQLGPDGEQPLSAGLLVQTGTRHVPCATILVRIRKAAIGPQGRPLEAEKVPQTDWVRLGLYEASPSYDTGLYQSRSCKPTRGECLLFQSLVKRPKISLRESLRITLDPAEMRKIRTDKHIEQYIRSHLTRLMDVTPSHLNMAIIAKYSPKRGIKFSLDGAINLPWSNYTHGHFCLNPPGAFYQGQPFASYDNLTFTNRLASDSTNKCPRWKDGFKWFPSRSYHRHLVMILHLQEVQVSVASDSYKYGLLDQAWTAVPIFTDSYVHTDVYQVPLFLGSPSSQTLKLLARQPTREFFREGIASGRLKFIPGASVIVRVADSRRDDELPNSFLADESRFNKELLPDTTRVEYLTRNAGRELATMVPQGRSTQEFYQSLASKFKSLVYKLYEEGNVNAK